MFSYKAQQKTEIGPCDFVIRCGCFDYLRANRLNDILTLFRISTGLFLAVWNIKFIDRNAQTGKG